MVSVLPLQADIGSIESYSKSVFVGCEGPERSLPDGGEDHRNRGAGPDHRGAAHQVLVPDGYGKTLIQGKTEAQTSKSNMLI